MAQSLHPIVYHLDHVDVDIRNKHIEYWQTFEYPG